MSVRTQSPEPSEQAAHRAGFACFVGRPNAGKSTLTNALVGKKVAITSNRPQTTRHTVRGIVHRPEAQLILVDTPGLHKPRTLLGERLNDVVRATWAEVDVIGFCLPANEKLGPGDRFIAKELASIKKTPKIAIVTKTDLVDSKALAEQLIAIDQLGKELGFEWAEIVPVSAVGETPVDLLAEVLAALVARTGIDPGEVDDVIVGCLDQVGEHGSGLDRGELVRVADEHDLLVYSDEIYDRLVYGDHAHTAFSALPNAPVENDAVEAILGKGGLEDHFRRPAGERRKHALGQGLRARRDERGQSLALGTRQRARSRSLFPRDAHSHPIAAVKKESAVVQRRVLARYREPDSFRHLL